MQSSCFKCHHQWSLEPPIGRQEQCPKCHSDVHSCLNCQYFDKNSHHECRESQAEWVHEKDKSNFCGYFTVLNSAKTALSNEASEAMSKLNQLFGGDPAINNTEQNSTDSFAEFLKKNLKK